MPEIEPFDEENNHRRNQLNESEKNELFSERFLPLMNSLYSFAFYLVNNEEGAKDLLQDTYMKAFRYLEYFEVGTNVKAWLMRIMKNNFINDYRKKSRTPTIFDVDKIAGNEVDAEDLTKSDLRQEFFQNLIGDELTNAINELPADYRLIILLSDIEEFKYDEIAAILDIPIGTVRSRLHRARTLLKEKLIPYAKQKGFKTE